MRFKAERFSFGLELLEPVAAEPLSESLGLKDKAGLVRFS